MLIVYILLVVLYFLPVLKTTLFCHQDRFALYGWDIVDSFYQSKSLIKKALSNGLIPWWNPFIHNGISLFGVCADSVFYPAILLYYFLPLVSSFTVLFMLHIILTGFGMFLLARALKLSLEASFMTGIIFMFCGFFYSKICTGHVPIIYTAAWVPYIFYAFEKARIALPRKDILKAAALGSVFVALAILAGHFQILFMELGALSFYVLFLLIWDWFDNKRIDVKPVLVFSLMVLLGIILSAAHFIPAMVDLNLANRSFYFKGEDTSWPVVSGFPFPPKDVITMIVPHLLNKVHYEDAAYLGILPLFLAFSFFLLLSRFDLNIKRKSIFFFVVALAGLLFSFGNQFPFFAIQYYFSPLRAIRVPARYLFLWHFGITLLAGFGLDSLIKNIDSTTKKRLGIFTLFLGGLFWLLVKSAQAYRPNNDLLCVEYLPLTLIGISTLIYLGLIIFSRNKKIFVWLGIFLIIADLFIYRYSGLRIVDYRGQRVFTYSDVNKVVEAPEIMEMKKVINNDSGNKFYRISYEDQPIRNYGFYPLMWQDVFLYDGPETSFSARTYEVQKTALDTLGPQSPIFDLFGVKYVWSSKDISTGSAKYEKATEHIYKNRKALSRAFVVHRALVLPKKEDILNKLSQSDFKPAEAALLEAGKEIDIPGPFRDEVVIDKYKFNSVKLATKTDKDGILILTDGYHPGWKAWLDGKKVVIFPVDWAVRGIYLPAGEHKVKFYFFPWYYKAGMGVTLVSSIFLLLFFVKLKRL